MAYPKKSVLALARIGESRILTRLSAFAAVVTILTIIWSVNSLRLSIGGTVVVGQIERLERGTKTCGKFGRRTCETFIVHYTFEPVGRPTRKEMRGVDRATFITLKEGQKLDVRYLIRDARVHEIGPDPQSDDAALAVAMAALSFSALFLFMLPRLGDARAIIRLRDHGDRRTAIVMRHDVAESSVPQGKSVAVWRDSAGSEGRTALHNISELPGVGAEIAIFADPSGSQASLWEGDVGSR